MAASIEKFEISQELTEFTGSSEDDAAHAKSFWQSLNLQPPMESRLVSSDIRQRLKRAPPGHQPIHYTYVPVEHDPKLSNFLLKSQYETRLEVMRRIRKLAIKKQETRSLLSKQRVHRIQQELISNHAGLIQREPTVNGPTKIKPTDEEDPLECQHQITEFDNMLENLQLQAYDSTDCTSPKDISSV